MHSSPTRNLALTHVTQAAFQCSKRDLSPETSPQSFLIVKLVQPSQLCIFLTEYTCTITLNFWTSYNSCLILKQFMYNYIPQNSRGKNRKQLKLQKILLRLCCLFFVLGLFGCFFFFKNLINEKKLLSISFYYIRRKFLHTT